MPLIAFILLHSATYAQSFSVVYKGDVLRGTCALNWSRYTADMSYANNSIIGIS
jgi:hypothetical protein